MILVAIPLRALLLPEVDRPRRPVVALVSYAFIGVCRGVTVAAMVSFFDLRDRQDWTFRPIGGLILNVILLPLIVWALDGSRRHKETLREVVDIRDALEESRGQFDVIIQSDRKRILDLIGSSVRGPLEVLKQTAVQGADERARVAELITNTIDGVVRPLSHQLDEEIREWRPANKVRVLPRIRWESLQVGNPFRPVLIGASMSGVALSPLSTELTILEAALVSLFFGFLGGTTSLVLKFVWKRIGPQAFSTTLIIAAGAHAISAVLLLPLLQSLFTRQWLITSFWTGGAVSLAFASSIVVFATYIQAAREELELELVTANQQLVVQVSELSSRMWVQQRQIAEILHGQVQSALIVASARLLSSRGALSAREGQEIYRPIELAMQRLIRVSQESHDLFHFLDDATEVWRNVLEIKHSITTDAKLFLERNPATSLILASVLREAFGNAFRHGKASMVHVEIETTDEGLLLVVSNDGALEGDSKPGLGTRLLESAAIRWQRGEIEGTQRLIAVLPVG